jgi:ATP-binding cassette subfamily B protein
MDADEILVLGRGRIVERGSHQQLLELKGEYARMWALQQEAAEAAAVLEKAKSD